MKNLSSRLVSFAGASVHLEYTNGRGADIVDFLFGRVPADDTVLPHVNIRLAEDPTDGRFTVYVAGAAIFSDRSPGAVATRLVHAMCREFASASRDGLVLHAAAVTTGSSCLLLPGVTGAGKTTLVAYLSTCGFGYLSDELSFIPRGTTRVESLTRPLKIKRSAVQVLEAHLAGRRNGTPPLESRDEVLEAAPVAAAPAVSGRHALAAIIFPGYQERAAFRLERISPARAGLRLMECLLNARNLDHHGFDHVVRVARAAPAFSLRYGSLEQIGDHLDRLRVLAPCPPEPAGP